MIDSPNSDARPIGAPRRTAPKTLRWLVLAAALVSVVGTSGDAHAQLDTRHWIPALWASDTGTSSLLNHYLILSTPETTPVAYTVVDGAGVQVAAGNVSNSVPVQIHLGAYANSVYASKTPGAGNILIGDTALSAKNTQGLVVVAAKPIYATIRHITGSQGTSLTAKGRKSLGFRFRAALMRNARPSNSRGSFVSVMATEDNTVVTFDDFKPGLRLTNTTASGNPVTTQTFSVTLNKHESYIVGFRMENYAGTADPNDFNGMLVAATKPVAVNSGCWLGGEGAVNGQDIGVDQIAPETMGGKEYVLIKGNAANGDLKESPLVLATEDGTSIYINGGATPTAVLDAGDYLFLVGKYSANGNMLVTSDKPILMAQTIGGSDSAATPGFNFIPPLAFDSDTFVDNISNVAQIGAATLGIIARKDFPVLLNGTAIDVSPQAVTGSDAWVTYRKTGVTGNIAVRSTGAIAVTIFNVNGVVGAAGYFSGFPAALIDLDFDGVPDGSDNCQDLANPRRPCSECAIAQPNCQAGSPPIQCNADGDSRGDACDGCPQDAAKDGPGICGCGFVDEDVFPANGVIDCLEEDQCPDDPDKFLPGICGCGIPDTDSDNDGTPDCNDDCPRDPAKRDPGSCGCGVADIDSDFDNTVDCNDGCPDDPAKIDAGFCGCGFEETPDCGFAPSCEDVSPPGSDPVGVLPTCVDTGPGGDEDPIPLAELYIDGFGSCAFGCAGGEAEVVVAVTIGNQGPLGASEVVVSLRQGSREGPVVATGLLDSIASGATGTVEIAMTEQLWGDGRIFATVLPGEATPECNRFNNSAPVGTWPVFEDVDDDGIDDVCDDCFPTGEEICDGLDNDCDGEVDAGYMLGEPCGDGVGACAASGKFVCDDAGGSVCDAVAGEPTDEICDAIDNDCDGQTDTGFALGEPCTLGVGACEASGIVVCDDMGGAECDATPSAPTMEVCDDLDNDCDGEVDQGFGLGEGCTVGLGVCAADGVMVCDGTGSAVCDGAPGQPTEELCDGLDNDCDGETDIGFMLGEPCTVGVGACAADGVFVCDGSGGAVCDAEATSPTAEICDGVDNDCDGSTDTGFRLGEACTVGLGACAADGVMVCVDGGGSSCDATPSQPTEEVCDGVDNDCDGATDSADTSLVRVACEKTEGVCAGALKPRTSCVTTNGTAQWLPCTSATYAGWAFESTVTTAGVPGSYSLDEAGGCDGLDNDCDGQTDEGFVSTPVSCGLGACAVTVQTACVEGAIDDSCEPSDVSASDEVCDGVDNDCDGTVDAADDSLALVECAEQRGVCAGSVAAPNLCVAGMWQPCGPSEFGAAYEPTDFNCNGLDDNCNGSTDEGYSAPPTSCGRGACAGNTGELACGAGGVLSNTCDPLDGATVEGCNNIDDDCDGDIDEDFALGEVCDVGVGACVASGTVICAQGGADTTCSAVAGSPAPEQCDSEGVDGNCDGVSDDVAFDLGTECAVGLGACQREGARICLPDGSAGCSAVPGMATIELCDGLDNDCDGIVDNDGPGGVACASVDTAIAICPDSPTSLNSFVFDYTETISDGDTFECKVDGGPWTRCDLGAFAVEDLTDGSHTFLVRALGLQGRFDTTPAFCVWTVDTQAPDTVILVGPENPAQSGSGTFVFGANIQNPMGYYCALLAGGSEDGPPAAEAFVPCDAVYPFTGLNDGLYTIYVYVVSESGVADQTPAVYRWLIDTTAPGTAIIVAPDPVVCDGTATIGFGSPTDISLTTFECRLDAEAWTACVAPEVTLTELAAGDHIYEVRAVDGTGNLDPTPARVAFAVDLTVPVTTIVDGPDDPSQRGMPVFAFTADDSGARFLCAIAADGAEPGADDFVTCTSPWTGAALADGAYVFHVRAVGQYCGEGEVATYAWVIDTSYPDTAFVTTPPRQLGTGLEATFTYTDPTDAAVTTFECRLDSGEWVACDGGATTLGSEALGSHQLEVRSCTLVGIAPAQARRCDPTPAAYTWVVTASQCPLDTTPPALTCPARTTLECVAGGASFDATGLGLSADDACGAVVAYEGSADGFYPKGLSPVVVSATDGNANVATCVAEVLVVDTAPPSITCPEDVSTTTDPGACAAVVALGTVTVDDSCSPGAVMASSDAPLYFTPGRTEVTYTARDPAGNVATCIVAVDVVDDEPLVLTCAASISEVAPPDACGWQGALTATVTDNCGVDVDLLEEANFFAVGTRDVRFEAADNAGNTDTCVTVLEVVDATAPTVDCGALALGEGAREVAPVFAQVTGADACGVVATVEGLTCYLVDADGQETELARELCPVSVDGDTITVSETVSGGDLRVSYTARAVDPSGLVAEEACTLDFDMDADSDGVPDLRDNCPATANTAQDDRDGDGLGDACDNCPSVANVGQEDSGTGVGDACRDGDEDGVLDHEDNCPVDPNVEQRDGDRDGLGDACDPVNEGVVASGAYCAGGDDGGANLGLLLLALVVLVVRLRVRGGAVRGS